MRNHAPQPGCFLLATAMLEGSYFQDRVIFLPDHSPTGSFGLILNFPSHIPLEEVFSGFRSRERKPFPFFVGGPVQEDSIYVLEIGPPHMRGARQVYPGIYLCEPEERQPIPLLDLYSNKSTRIFLGYSGWAGEQLENEIAQGCWEVVTPPPLAILTCDRDLFYATPADFKRQFVLY